jgi:hypothetical protein
MIGQVQKPAEEILGILDGKEQKSSGLKGG